MVEIVPEMADHFRDVLPASLVLEGESFAGQRRFITAIEAVAPGRGFPWGRHGLAVRREA